MDDDLKTYLERMENRIVEMDSRMTNRLLEMDHRLIEMENRLIEKMRDMQTELLRGFEAFSSAQSIRLRKLEADQSNLDASLRGRVDILESRLTQIELRLGKLLAS
jgi:hypothetical protein